MGKHSLLLAASLLALTAGQAIPQGFSLTLNGDAVDGEADIAAEVSRVDRVLERADVRVSYDGLTPEPRLALEVVAASETSVQVQSSSNYPAFVTRGEVVLIDRDAPGGPRVVARQPLDPNGTATLARPDGDLVAVYRVYDRNGRFDETEAVALEVLPRTVAGVERGIDLTAKRSIRVYGGTIRVAGGSVAPGASIRTLGETLSPDPSGAFVIERILPPGIHPVQVAVAGPGAQPVDLTRDIEVPNGEFLTVGAAEITIGRRDDETFEEGRIAAYVEGRTANGYEVTARIDTGEQPLDELFDALEDRDPRDVLSRVDPRDLYPTYGDDSVLEDRTPSSGRVFARVEKDGNFLQWGDFAGNIGNNSLVRNERQLYGLQAQAQAQTQAVTERGEARATVSAYAASPERLPQRDLFQGTGGSVYFLRQQDLAIGTEVVTVQLRDPDTDRVVETRQLTLGEDYTINYIQGVIVLSRPLTARGEQGILGLTGISDPLDAVLAVQYEFTPGAFNVDGEAAGARAEVWVTDDLRFGVAGIRERTGGADQTLTGADLLWQIGENSSLNLEVARSDGPGFGSTFSPDGGLAFETEAAQGGEGDAYKAELSLYLQDLGLSTDGVVSAYAERREEGFSSLDFQTGAATGDETLWGFAAEVKASERLTFAVAYDRYENDAGRRDDEFAAEAIIDLTDRFELGLGLYHEERAGRTTKPNGDRTDAAARLTYAATADLDLSVFGQATIDETGLGDDDRAGVGVAWRFAPNWELSAELSDGDRGEAGDVLVSYSDEAGNTRYIGWTLDPERTIGGTTLRGSDRGQLVFGARQTVNDRIAIFGENTYDVFGRYRSLTSAYGVEYKAHEDLDLTFAVEIGRADDRPTTDLDRRAYSFGAVWERSDISAAMRVEYRDEDGLRAGTRFSSESWLVSGDLEWKLDETQRIVASIDHAEIDTDTSALLDGDYTDVILGYAFRPITNDKLNVLARYRYLDDQVGQRVDGLDQDGPRQRSHVASIDAIWDVSPRWTVVGKLGYRASETSASINAPFIDNDAWLAVASVRWHLPKKWDLLFEARQFEAVDAQTSDTGALAAVYRQINDNYSVGLGYNFGSFSDDLTDLVQDDDGLFLNLCAQF